MIDGLAPAYLDLLLSNCSDYLHTYIHLLLVVTGHGALRQERRTKRSDREASQKQPGWLVPEYKRFASRPGMAKMRVSSARSSITAETNRKAEEIVALWSNLQSSTVVVSLHLLNQGRGGCILGSSRSERPCLRLRFPSLLKDVYDYLIGDKYRVLTIHT